MFKTWKDGGERAGNSGKMKEVLKCELYARGASVVSYGVRTTEYPSPPPVSYLSRLFTLKDES